MMKWKNKVILAVFAVIVCLIYVLLPYPTVTLTDAKETAIDQYMLSKLEELRIPGAAIGIVDQGEITMKGYGVRNANGDEMTPQTEILLGSTTKSITAVAIMQLAEQGKLGLDDAIIKYLPEFSFDQKEDSRAITIRQLLNQTSGIAGPTGGSDFLDGEQTADEFVSRLKYEALSMNPGEEYQYAEANYIILGQIVEAASGQTYASYVEEHIFTPLHMTHSFTTKEAAQESGLSDGYRTWFGFPVKVELPHPKQYLSASGLYSNVEDMVHYMSMYLQDGSYEGRAILSEASLKEITKPAVLLKHPVGYSYGMGWFVGDGVITHDGRPTNYYSAIIMNQETDRGIVLIANTNNRLITAEYMMPMVFEMMNALEGKANTGASFGFRQMYRLLNVILLLMFALPLYRFILFIRKKNQKSLIRTIIPELLNFSVVLSILLWLLNSYGVHLRIAFLGQPDIVLVIVATLVLILINIVVKLLISLKKATAEKQ